MANNIKQVVYRVESARTALSSAREWLKGAERMAREDESRDVSGVYADHLQEFQGGISTVNRAIMSLQVILEEMEMRRNS